MASLIYNSCLHDVCSGDVDFAKDDFGVILAPASYNPSKDHSRRSDVPEVMGLGYPAGGTPVTLSVSKSRDAVNVTLGGTEWNPVTVTARYAVYFKRRGGRASADELVAAIDFGGDVSATNGVFMVNESILRVQN